MVIDISSSTNGVREREEREEAVWLSEHVGTILIKARGSGERWCKVIRHPDTARRVEGAEGEEEGGATVRTCWDDSHQDQRLR
jgi:hypothetical protein